MRVIHLVDQFCQGNHGILEAAVGTADELKGYGIDSEIWLPKTETKHTFNFRSVEVRWFQSDKELDELCRSVLAVADAFPRTVVVSHGSWQWPTKIARQLKRGGLKWIYSPHGMLEPWSMKQKRIRKLVYYYLRERRYVNSADIVRATSEPEYQTLCGLFSQVEKILNGVTMPTTWIRKEDSKIRCLYMGRFHHKKCPVELANAWVSSTLAHDSRFELIMVGNDQGELPRLKRIASEHGINLFLRDPVYGTKKEELFSECDYFVLPSQSEGAPMALMEAMAAGLVPLISTGCNFPEAIASGLAIPIGTSIDGILPAINALASTTKAELQSIRPQVRTMIQADYSVHAIAMRQRNLFYSLCQSADKH